MATASASSAIPNIGSAIPGFTSTGAFQFKPPETFSGKREEFEEWGWPLKAYLSLIHPAYSAKMNEAELHNTSLPDEFFRNPDGSINQNVVQMSTNLHYILVTSCKGQAAVCLRQSSDPNGFENWRILITRSQFQREPRQSAS